MRLNQLKEAKLTSNRSATAAELIEALPRLEGALAAFDQGVHVSRGVHVADAFRYQPELEAGARSHTYTFHNMLIDESPYWIGYPPRLSSVICTNEKNYAAEFGVPGGVYLVLPEDDPIVGVAPAADAWDSFRYMESELDLHSLDTINFIIRNLTKVLLGLQSYQTDNIHDLEQKLNFAWRAYYKMDNKERAELGSRGLEYQTQRLLDYSEHMPLLQTIQELMSPEKNGFTKTRFSGLAGHITGEHELWFRAPTWMINYDDLPVHWNSWKSRDLIAWIKNP